MLTFDRIQTVGLLLAFTCCGALLMRHFENHFSRPAPAWQGNPGWCVDAVRVSSGDCRVEVRRPGQGVFETLVDSEAPDPRPLPGVICLPDPSASADLPSSIRADPSAPLFRAPSPSRHQDPGPPDLRVPPPGGVVSVPDPGEGVPLTLLPSAPAVRA